ncbi:MAG: hypothetical protein KIT84_00870 [Labilithrix sp.]|nr:hypothetical protein [Labilithrix sp.]MCW5809536.1 hypothetical protein [Labilithrix sp.]
MKLPLLGAVLTSTLVACSGADPAPDAAEQPAAATQPAAPAEKTDPAAQTTPEAQPTETAPEAEPAPTGPVVETCATLAGKSTTPAGKLAVTAVSGFFDIEPVDVYATVSNGELVITLTETGHECGYRTNKLAHQRVNELRFHTRLKDGAVAVGELDARELSAEAGEACVPPLEEGEVRASSRRGAADRAPRGKIKITAATDTEIEGSVDVRDWSGQKTTFTFTAPICAAAEGDSTCCAAQENE